MRTKAELAVSVAILLGVSWMVWYARDWSLLARLFPTTIGVLAIVVAAVQCGFAVRNVMAGAAPAKPSGYAVAAEAVPADVVRRRTWEIALWFLVFGVGVMLLGFRVSALLLPLAFLKVAARESWRTAVPLAAGIYFAFYLIFSVGLHIPFPPGAVADVLGIDSFDSYVVDPAIDAIGRLIANF